MPAIQNRPLLYETATLPTAEMLPKADLLPPGFYPAILKEVKPFANSWGGRMAFVFEVSEGEQAGATAILTTGVNLTPRSRLGRAVSALLGRDLTDAELKRGTDLETLVGRSGGIVLGRANNKAGQPYTTVETIVA